MKESKVLKAGMWYTIGNYFLKGLSFFSLPIFTRILSASDYGIYNTFIAYENILFIFIGLAIHSSYKNAKYKFNIDSCVQSANYYTYVSNTMILIILNAVGWIIITNILFDTVQDLIQLERFSANVLIVYSFSSAVLTCFNVDVSLQYQYQRFFKISLINAIINIVLSIILINLFFDKQRYVGRMLGTTIPVLILAIYIIISFFRRAKPQKAYKQLEWGIKYSLPIIPHGISQVILSQFDRLMIARMVGQVEAGIYSFGYNVYTIVSITGKSLDNVWGPWFYEQRYKLQYEKIKSVSSIYIIAMLVFSIILMLISPEIVAILGTKEYHEAIYCVIPLVASAFFSFLYTIPASVEYFHENTKYIAVGTVGAAVINVILNMYFIDKYGYVMAAYTTLFTYVIYFLFHYFFAWKIEKRCLFSNKTVIFSVISILFFVYISQTLIEDFWSRVWIACLILALGLSYEEIKIGLVKKYIMIRLKKRNMYER